VSDLVLPPGLAADLSHGVAALGVAVTPAQQRQLLDFVALLATWNRTYNLTAIREPERMVTHHLLDALAVLPHLPQRAGLRMLDVGAGGGIPGIPLAIARPDWHVTLVDTVHKKVAFIQQAAIELGLRNVDAQAVRVEALVPSAPFDVVISRAFADIATFAATSARHLARDGWLVAMKGVHPHEELAEVPPSLHVAATHALRVPGLDAARHLVVLQHTVEPQ
jgi:16S rRNA (guanine527-N7)-methyltransferase